MYFCYIILIISVAAIPVSSTNSPLIKLTNDRARCMDGTLSGYYFQANTTERGGNKWIIHLQGGGECDTAEDCQAKLNSDLGSSNYFSSSVQQPFMCSDDEQNNPDLWDFNHVYIPYCTGDLHSGMVEEPDESTFYLYFAGHFVVASVVEDLIENKGLAYATDVILSGDSAGGIGTWINVDYLAERLAEEKTNQGIDEAARIVAAPIAGFYFYVTEPYQGPDHTSSSLTNFSASGIEHAYTVWHSFVDDDCKAGRSSDPWACLLSNYSLPYIQSDAFVTEAQTDEVVLQYHDWVPSPPQLCDDPETLYVHRWSLQMRQALQPLLDSNNTRFGVFSPACFIHTDFSSSGPLINGYNYLQAFGNWYFNKTNGEYSTIKLWDHCGFELYCNPTCSNPC